MNTLPPDRATTSAAEAIDVLGVRRAANRPPEPGRPSIGRPSKLTLELQEKLCGIIRAGNYMTTAAAACGIAEATVYRWLSDGKADDAPEQLQAFRQAVEAARAEAETRMVSYVELDAGGGSVIREVIRELPDGSTEITRHLAPANGRLALEYLARSRPERWRPIKTLEISRLAGGPVGVEPNAAVIESIITRV